MVPRYPSRTYARVALSASLRMGWAGFLNVNADEAEIIAGHGRHSVTGAPR